MNIITCIDMNNGIGNNGQLLERVDADMVRFKNLTMNKVVIMGRRTFESLPGRRALAGRYNIVLTRNKYYHANYASTSVVYSKEELLQLIKPFMSEDIFVIGGSEIYNMLIEYCDRLYITRINNVYTSDTKFPEISMEQWELEYNSGVFTNPETGNEYSFWDYKRKNMINLNDKE